MKRHGVDRMFPCATQLVNGVQDMNQKMINRGSYKVCR